jgi:hypothetical protein
VLALPASGDLAEEGEDPSGPLDGYAGAVVEPVVVGGG